MLKEPLYPVQHTLNLRSNDAACRVSPLDVRAAVYKTALPWKLESAM
jgi:hypothetical protein